MRTLYLRGWQIFLKTFGLHGHRAIGLQRKRCTVKHHLVLPAHQVGIDERQPGGVCALGHTRHPLAALAHVERRRVDDSQHFRPGLFGQARRLFKPGVFTNQQADLDALHLKHTHTLPWREITALVKHLVVGQLAFGVGVLHHTMPQHTGHVEALLHRHRAGAGVAAAGVAHHHHHVL